MQHIDRLTIEKYGIAGIVLMERAGLGVVSKINEIFYQNVDDQHLRKIVVLCGGGNNGGDGLVIARILHNQGRDVEVYLAAKPDSLTGDAKVNYDAAKKFGVKIYPLKKFLTDYPLRSVSKCIIVDALLGTGLSKEVRAPLSDIIDKVNKMIAAVVSVDIPSGISSDTGSIR
jgi:NAD(P)H-hydrate epimerase